MQRDQGLTAFNLGPARSWLWAVPAGFALRLVVVAFVYKDFLVPDRGHWEFGYEIGKIAGSIATGHGFGNPYFTPTGPTALTTPVYPYLLAGIFLLFGVYTKPAALAILTVNCLVSALTSIVVFLIARQNFEPRVAKWAAWIWAFFPYAIYYSAADVTYHSLVAFVMALLFLTALYLQRSASLWAWAGFGLLWGVSALIHPVVLGVAPFLSGWSLYRLSRCGKGWKAPGAIAAIVLGLTLTPWLIRNYRTFHQPVFLKDNFWMEFCVGNLGNDLHWWHASLHPSGNHAEMEQFQTLGELGYIGEKKQLALAYLRHHWGNFLWQSLRRLIFTWTGFWSFRREYLREEPLDPLNIFFSTTLSLFALSGLRRAFHDTWKTAMPFAILLLTFPMVYYITHLDPPYRHPLDPALVVLSSYGLVSRLQVRFEAPGEVKAAKA